MMNRATLHALILSLLFAAGNSYAPSVPTSNPNRVPFFVNVKESAKAPVPPQTAPPANMIMESHTASATASQEATASQPQTPAAPKKQTPSSAANKNKKTDAKGPFAPLVLLSKDVLGDEKLNKIRAKAISLHSDVIANFVETADTPTGQRVLKWLFELADVDHNGAIDEQELAMALQKLGFDHLKQKQVAGIFARADADGNGVLEYDEWKAEAPKTLRTNLIKLAKKNGHDLGFLA